MSSRIVIWRDVLTIVGDYQFTGAGLGTSEMILSSYLYLLHVPYLYHVHNLFIQIALEQGIIGVVGFGCIVLAAGTAGILTTMTSSRYRTVAAASMTSLVALVVYGLFDSDLYVGWQVIFIFVPVGFNWVLADQRIQPIHRERERPGRVRPGDVLMGVAPLLLILGMWLRPETEAALYANLGAVAQAKAELSVYKWERWLIQDRVRRNHIKDLAPAIAYYRMALAEDPLNSTVHRRLGQIYLSLGDYSAALGNLEAARALAPEQRTIRQLLGEVYAVLGDSVKAAQLWQSVNDDQYQLEARLWWYRSLGAAEEARRVEQVLQQIRDDPEPIYTGN
ncbi:MAG: O-antigen ligase family protein [Caldilineaceae bacterium]|nr:O-antigen ligase family protein [Caldilineaceae bacterium]